MGHIDHVDREELARIFIEETPPEVGYREFAEEWTPKLPCTNWTELSHVQVRDWGRDGRWMSKRSKFLAEKYPGLFEDAERQYYLIMQRFYSEIDTMSPTEINQLSGTLNKLRDVLMNRSDGSEEYAGGQDWITKDAAVQLFKEEYRAKKDAMISVALEYAEPHETK